MEIANRISLLSLCLLIASGSLEGAYEGPRLTRCPLGDLTLQVPEDLPEGALLFGWDPDLVVVSSSREAYKRLVSKALNPRASPNTRAFFIGAPAVKDAVSLAPGGQPWAALSRPLPTATHLLRGGDYLTCTPALKPSGPAVLVTAAHPVTKFRVHLRLLPVPLRIWRRPWTHMRLAVATTSSSSSSFTPDAEDIRAGASLRLNLAPLMATAGTHRHPPPRVRLLAASHPARVRLLPVPAPGALLLDLPPVAEPLEVTLEARNFAGRTEVANLTLTSASILHSPAASASDAWWWLAPLLAFAAALALTVSAFCTLVLWCRLRRSYTGVKPDFV